MTNRYAGVTVKDFWLMNSHQILGLSAVKMPAPWRGSLQAIAAKVMESWSDMT